MANSCVSEALIVENQPHTCDCERHHSWNGNECLPTNYWEEYNLDTDQYMDLETGIPGFCYEECVSCANGSVYDCYACGPDAFFGDFTISSTGLISGNCVCPNNMFIDVNSYEKKC